MPFLDNKPEPYKRGQQSLSARDLNLLRGGMPRHIAGGPGADVSYYGDRLTVNLQDSNPQLPPVELFHRQYAVLLELDDCIVCAPYNQFQGGDLLSPQVYDPNLIADQGTGGGVNGNLLCLVAKPYWLQKTPWELQTVTVNGDITTYHYTGVGKRNAVVGSDTFAEAITPNYLPGDIIVAVRTFTGYEEPSPDANPGAPVLWMDANTAGRKWGSSKCCAAPAPPQWAVQYYDNDTFGGSGNNKWINPIQTLIVTGTSNNAVPGAGVAIFGLNSDSINGNMTCRIAGVGDNVGMRGFTAIGTDIPGNSYEGVVVTSGLSPQLTFNVTGCAGSFITTSLSYGTFGVNLGMLRNTAFPNASAGFFQGFGGKVILCADDFSGVNSVGPDGYAVNGTPGASGADAAGSVFLKGICTGVGSATFGTGTVAEVDTDMSVAGGPITGSGTITLVNDSTSPGNSNYYGTDTTGVKGFFSLPSGAGGMTVGGDLSGTLPNPTVTGIRGASVSSWSVTNSILVLDIITPAWNPFALDTTNSFLLNASILSLLPVGPGAGTYTVGGPLTPGVGLNGTITIDAYGRVIAIQQAT